MSEPAFPGRLSREDPDLSERQRQVFAALLTLHGRSARPIGSETLAQLAGIPLSPASIRNALAELESLGLLERHHSSAGRVPSVRGYELYVRVILTPEALPPEVMEEVGAGCSGRRGTWSTCSARPHACSRRSRISSGWRWRPRSTRRC